MAASLPAVSRLFEGGERAARLAAEGLDLAGQRREVGLRGVEHAA